MKLRMTVSEADFVPIKGLVSEKLCDLGYHEDISLNTSVPGNLIMKKNNERVEVVYDGREIEMEIIPHNEEIMGYLHNLLNQHS